MGLFGNNNVLKKNKIGGYIVGASVTASEEAIRQIDNCETKLDIDYDKQNTKLLVLGYVSASMLDYIENKYTVTDRDADTIMEHWQTGMYRVLNDNFNMKKCLDYLSDAGDDIEVLLPGRAHYQKMLELIYDDIVVFDNSKYDTEAEFDKYQEFVEEIHDIIAGVINLSLYVIGQKDIRI